MDNFERAFWTFSVAALLLLLTNPPQPKSVCYGQHKPICNQGQAPVCVCVGEIGQHCGYICVPHDPSH